MTPLNGPERNHLRIVGWVIGIGGVAAFCLAALFIGTGAFNIAADSPHTKPVAWLMQTVRNRSIEVRAHGIEVPADLSALVRVKRGAAEYSEMCAMCHVGPGVERSELSQGLYPPAPELARNNPLPVNAQFWVIKHGIKMTAMPSWGMTHDDKILWDIVAFLQKLPKLTPEQYRALTRDATEEHHMMGAHDGGDHDAMPGMTH
jgi:mono/diheme cytochrome c family protein